MFQNTKAAYRVERLKNAEKYRSIANNKSKKLLSGKDRISAKFHFNLAAQQYNAVGDQIMAELSRAKGESMGLPDATQIINGYHGETNPDKLRIMYGKLASVYSKHGMSEKARNALQKSVAGGRRRTKRSKKSNRRTRRHKK